LLQKNIIRIIIMVPIYAFGSALSITQPNLSIYINTIRDVYEAFVIHCFLQVMLDYPGGEQKVVEGILDKPRMKHPIPCCCLPKIRLDHSFIIMCKQTTLQFVVLKPLMAFISLILMFFHEFEHPIWQYILLVVYNFSYTLALYGLLLFYFGTKHLLKGFNAVGKFTAVKIIVFATYYQSLLVATVPGMDVLGSSEKWNDFIICIEMSLFAYMHMRVFSYKDFLPDSEIVKRTLQSPDGGPINVKIAHGCKDICHRIADVANFQDVLQDANRNFNSNYGNYIMQGIDGGILSETDAELQVSEQETGKESRVMKGMKALGITKLKEDKVVAEVINVFSTGTEKIKEGLKDSVDIVKGGVDKVRLSVKEQFGGGPGMLSEAAELAVPASFNASQTDKRYVSGSTAGDEDDPYGSVSGAVNPVDIEREMMEKIASASAIEKANAAAKKRQAELLARANAAKQGKGLKQEDLELAATAEELEKKKEQAATEVSSTSHSPENAGVRARAPSGSTQAAGQAADIVVVVKASEAEKKVSKVLESAAAARIIIEQAKKARSGAQGSNKRAGASTSASSSSSANATSEDFDVSWDEAVANTSNPPPASSAYSSSSRRSTAASISERDFKLGGGFDEKVDDSIEFALPGNARMENELAVESREERETSSALIQSDSAVVEGRAYMLDRSLVSPAAAPAPAEAMLADDPAAASASSDAASPATPVASLEAAFDATDAEEEAEAEAPVTVVETKGEFDFPDTDAAEVAAAVSELNSGVILSTSELDDWGTSDEHIGTDGAAAGDGAFSNDDWGTHMDTIPFNASVAVAASSSAVPDMAEPSWDDVAEGDFSYGESPRAK
jgi:Organic solute transporter Ostalpha